MKQSNLPLINTDRCNRCGACVIGCPEQALTMTDDGPIFNYPILCTYCTECEGLCPVGAIRAPLIISWKVEP